MTAILSFVVLDNKQAIRMIERKCDVLFHSHRAYWLPFLSSNIASSPADVVFICQLIRYVRECSSYECFNLKVRRLSSKLLNQGYLV